MGLTLFVFQLRGKSKYVEALLNKEPKHLVTHGKAVRPRYPNYYGNLQGIRRHVDGGRSFHMKASDRAHGRGVTKDMGVNVVPCLGSICTSLGRKQTVTEKELFYSFWAELIEGSASKYLRCRCKPFSWHAWTFQCYLEASGSFQKNQRLEYELQVRRLSI